MRTLALLGMLGALAMLGCESGTSVGGGVGGDDTTPSGTDTGTAADADADTDTDSDSDGDSDTDSDTDGDTDSDTDLDAGTTDDCVDKDSDGWCAALDCNDGNVNVNPNQVENETNGIDDDCDGQTDEDNGVDTDTNTNGCPANAISYIWIANTGDPDASLPDEGTLSKVETATGIEVARYVTSPQGADGDPSRTSVNLHGDMVVTNRSPAHGKSSVTKFAADTDDCVDKDSDSVIETSTGPSDVLPWGEDECMIWNTPLPGLLGGNTGCGARATAWDGQEDPDTGTGGHVFIGAMETRKIFKLDGDTGKILATGTAPAAVSPYGGAVDNQGNFWIVSMTCTVGLCNVARVKMSDLTSTVFKVHCGYGISVDSKGRVWTAGLGCVSRLDPSVTPAENKWAVVGGFNRGVAVDGNGSVWAAGTSGNLVQVDEDTLQIKHNKGLGKAEMVGVAVDCDGYVWVVSQGGNEAYRVDPVTYQKMTVPIGPRPYTYSDMTGMQLRNAVQVE